MVVNSLQSPLKWAGSKRWLVPRLSKLYEPYRDRMFVDLFAGAANVVLGVMPMRAQLSDLNPHLVNFYLRMCDPRPFEIEMRYDERLYYAYRECFNTLIKTQARYTRVTAELFYYLNRTCFNGLCRFNSVGNFNVPFGRYRTVNYRRDFSEYSDSFSKWILVKCDFSIALPSYGGCFVYADPPYDGTFANYNATEFVWSDQVRLAEELAEYDGPVVASNAATDRILELYRDLGFKIELIDAPRSISSDGDRSLEKEMLAIKVP